MIADSGALYALYDADDRHHRSVRSAVDSHRGPIIVPIGILAEVDYLLREFLGVDAELEFLEALETGAFVVETTDRPDLRRCRQLIARYRDLDIGFSDAAVVATAERLGVWSILTVDERHFRVIRSQKGRPFTLLPADV